ncbi:hypothetical protein NG800_018415 [Epilithonimonas ginsengisoli]|uniref:Uncharacterized protein n=1 Tax=Epilithonimonas ginsengisoli TaxID=1245592 RepID=A0ABU4JMM5_9FLAO|nr:MULTISPECIES: hypothetical protein [Chryseobacterium group]MBV6881776.1 hypothetical protein [Epilithonimonas sp. FP105]MDW8550907.1 hypothetical protein [Epilithonimonas ginsengisoli]OAH66475.1 hypothetical protein AXA65_17885 [Chryseobacterium sp. FP211-J200]
MSIIRITEGTHTTEIEGSWTVFTDTFEAYAGQFSHFTAANGTLFGTPKKDEVRKSNYFKEGIWCSDAEGTNTITQAAIGQVVYFHIKTQDITAPNAKVQLQLYDEDGGAGDDLINVREVRQDGSLGELITEKSVTNNKIVYNLTLSDGLAGFIEDDFGDEIELFFQCSYGEDTNVKLPLLQSLYLKVEICDKSVVQNFNNRQYGSCDFYRFRYDDFMRRHKNCGHMPPVYYFGEMRKVSSWSVIDDINEWWTLSLTEEMKKVSVSVLEIEKQGNKYKPVPSLSYGFKYCTRFSRVLMPKLTARGQAWLTESKIKLQEFMEKGVIEKTYAAIYDTMLVDELEDNFNDNFERYDWDTWSYIFDQEKQKQYYTNIELDNNRFQEFAFATHPDAYNPMKMQKLPLEDLIRVALTPDLKEWFGEGWWMTLKQAILVGTNYNMNEIRRLIGEFNSEEIKIFLDELWENIFN